ncbi:MAG: LytTR family transcriptional regulator [Bacteroidales bacterium]|nr:LytTR family transcriptional regulator [Bacteroidales bacterium]
MGRHLIISTSSELVRAASAELVYISSDGNYSTLVFASGDSRVVAMQLGQIATLIDSQFHSADNSFIRIGKSLIINRDFISYINPGRGQLVLSDGRIANHSLPASREALKQLKDLIEKEEA